MAKAENSDVNLSEPSRLRSNGNCANSASASDSDSAKQRLISDPAQIQELIGDQFLNGINGHMLVDGRLGKATPDDLFRCFVSTTALSSAAIRIDGFPKIDSSQINAQSDLGLKMSEQLRSSDYRPYHALIRLAGSGFGGINQLLVSAGRLDPVDGSHFNRVLRKNALRRNSYIDPDSAFAQQLLPAMLTEASTINESEYRQALLELRDNLLEQAFSGRDPSRAHWRSGIDHAEKLALAPATMPNSLLLRRGFFSFSHNSGIAIEEAVEASIGEMFFNAAPNLDFEQIRFIEAELRKEGILTNSISENSTQFRGRRSFRSPLKTGETEAMFTVVNHRLLGASSPVNLHALIATTSKLENEARDLDNQTKIQAKSSPPGPSLADTCRIIDTIILFDLATGLAERQRFDLAPRFLLETYAKQESKFASQLLENLINETVRVEHGRAQGEKPAPLDLTKKIVLPSVDIQRAIQLGEEELERRLEAKRAREAAAERDSAERKKAKEVKNG